MTLPPAPLPPPGGRKAKGAAFECYYEGWKRLQEGKTCDPPGGWTPDELILLRRGYRDASEAAEAQAKPARASS